jgi:DNA repair protein RadC
MKTNTATRDMFAVDNYLASAPLAGVSEKMYQAPIVRVKLVKESTMEMRLQVRAPADLARDLSARFAECDREHFIAVSLDTKNRVLAVEVVAIGSLDAAMISVRESFKAAMIVGAAAVIFAHNHPSGDPTPSAEDMLITRTLVEAGQLLDIQVLDHLVLGEFGRFVSMREKGMGFSK